MSLFWGSVLVFLWFVIIFSFSLHFTSKWVSRLLTYHDYRRYMKKSGISRKKMFFIRLNKVIFTYLPLGVSLGLILFLIGISLPPAKAVISGITDAKIALSAFLISFISVMSIRLIVLADKSRLVKKIGLVFVDKFVKEFNYKKQKEYVESFLFSIIFLTVFTTLMYAGVKIILGEALQGAINFTYNINPIAFTMFLFSFLTSFYLASIIIELLLAGIGVHKEYIKRYKF